MIFVLGNSFVFKSIWDFLFKTKIATSFFGESKTSFTLHRGKVSVSGLQMLTLVFATPLKTQVSHFLCLNLQSLGLDLHIECFAVNT